MKIISADNLYFQLEKHLLFMEKFTEIDDLAFLLKACRLKPLEYLLNKKNKLELFQHWIDEYHNSLLLKKKKKKVAIIFNDLQIPKTENTDLYYGLSLNKIAKMSNLFYLLLGKEEDTQQDMIWITFLGIDNYFRSYLYYNQQWTQMSSLWLGVPRLLFMIQHRHLRYFKNLSIKEKTDLPCLVAGEWLSYHPVNQVLLSMLDRKYPEIFNFLTKEKTTS
jgi:hypothetical protein